MLPHWCADVAFILAALLPFFIATRWEGRGFVLSILFGWGIIHLANVNCAPPLDGDDVRTAAVFSGLWSLLGPVFMAVWTAVAACVILTFSFAVWLARGRPVIEESPTDINQQSTAVA